MLKQKLHNFKIWVKEKWKKLTLIILTIGGGIVLASQIPEPLPTYQVIEWERPTTQAGWAEDVKKESLHFKYDYQLDQMEENLTEKLPKTQEQLFKHLNCPGCIKWEIKEDDIYSEWGTEIIDKVYQERLAYWQWKTDKISQSLERIKKEKELRAEKKVSRKPRGTTYYIDCDNGTSTNDGSQATTSGGGVGPYGKIDDFASVARSAGDKAIVRRGNSTTCDNGISSMGFTSDGTLLNPITIETDYDDVWGDFASSSQTYTVTFGSTTMTASAEITDILAHDWIYVDGDERRDFAYEVASVGGTGTTTLTLYLPYKGDQSGSGKGLEIMPDAPIWGEITDDYYWGMAIDNWWILQGIEVRGSYLYGQIGMGSSQYGTLLKDMIFQGDGVSTRGIGCAAAWVITIRKCRTFNCSPCLSTSNYVVYVYDSLFDANNTGNYVFDSGGTNRHYLIDTTLTNSNTYNLYCDKNAIDCVGRNLILDSEGDFYVYGVISRTQGFVEDFMGVIGNNKAWTRHSPNSITMQSETTTVRSGGGATSIKVIPTIYINNNWELGYMKLFEYPVYADTVSRQYSMYLRPENATSFGVSPLADELWIECEYWGSATYSHRKITKSTGVIDASSTAWQAISVTCQPSQAGILYLRAYYAKPKEAASNIFYTDVAPVIQ